MRHAALFLLLGLPGLAHAQSPDAVALTVRVRAEGEPVAGAVVRVGAEQVKTDAAGQVTLALAPGGHDITSARAHATPSGRPEAMPFAMVTMSPLRPM